MKKLRLPALALIAFAALAAAGCAEMLQAIESLDAEDASTPADGLREALRVGTSRAVKSLSAEDGYLGHDEVRIRMPDRLEPLARALDAVGQGDLVDEFVTSMNRAAEAAAPVAREVFLDSISEMTFDDAMTILRGEGHEATDYFREHAGPRLAERFRPIVDDKLDQVGATGDFNELVDKVNRLPFLQEPVFDLGDYVTTRALDGLFRMLAHEEERIREDPVARTTELLKKWFGE
jgi:hypothetical protein